MARARRKKVFLGKKGMFHLLFQKDKILEITYSVIICMLVAIAACSFGTDSYQYYRCSAKSIIDGSFVLKYLVKKREFIIGHISPSKTTCLSLNVRTEALGLFSCSKGVYIQYLTPPSLLSMEANHSSFQINMRGVEVLFFGHR